MTSIRLRVLEIQQNLRREDGRRFALAELNDLLSSLPSADLAEAIRDLSVDGLSPLLQNYVVAMVEHVSQRHGQPPPAWVRGVEPLAEPHFAVPFVHLRPHLLRASPVAFKRRNIFVDATVGDRV